MIWLVGSIKKAAKKCKIKERNGALLHHVAALVANPANIHCQLHHTLPRVEPIVGVEYGCNGEKPRRKTSLHVYCFIDSQNHRHSICQDNQVNNPSLVLTLLLSTVLSVSTIAQAAQEATTPFSRKRIEIVRTELKPTLDGVLDDEIWQMATVITDVHQFSPVDQGAPSEQTEVWIAYDQRFFYLAARLHDSEPDGIISRQLVQGGNFNSDDAFEFVLDTFNSGRTGYSFQVNPNGIRREGMYENPSEINQDWSGIWQVESKIDGSGWTAEVAIPFNTLNFDPESDEWGFTFSRTIARKREEIAWSSFNRNINPTTTGIIYGIHDIRQGRGLDIVPSLSVGSSRNYAAGVEEQIIEPSINVFYKFTPNLTGALTLNTDFSATEVDNRQVNLSRFSLFFPEKRDFFLQDVDIFSFGGLDQNGIPFYSRRIGLSPMGTPVDINAGVKLTGRIGDWNVGSLLVQQGETPTLDAQQVFVGRVAANVLSESSVGAIFTQGDPARGTDNSVAGMDFRYQNTRFSDSHTLRGNAWFQQSSTTGLVGDDKAFGVQANFDTQNNGFGGMLGYNYLGEDFNPALGFANNTGVQGINFMGSGRYFLQGNKWFRAVNTFMRYNYTEKLDTGELQQEEWFWRVLNFNTHRGGQIGIGGYQNKEGLEKPFQIRPGIFIPAGEYTFGGIQGEIRFAEQNTLQPRMSFNSGSYYDGSRNTLNGALDYRPNSHLAMGFEYQYTDASLPQGDFVTRLVRFNVNYAYNSKLSWLNLMQYDNGSKVVGLNSRFRWNPQAGEDLYLVINYNFNSEGTFTELSSERAELVLKYTCTFRF